MEKKRYYNNQPNVLEMLVEIFAGLIFLLGKMIYKLIRYLFNRSIKISKGSYSIMDGPYTNISDLEFTRNNKTTTLDATYLSEKQSSSNGNENRYNLKENPMSPAEENFFFILKQIVDGKYTIQTQVQLSSIVKPKDSNAHYTNYSDLNKIIKKSVDFVLYDKRYKPVLVIELDDSSHFKWDRIKRDEFVNAVMKDVGLRIIHIRAPYSYSPKYLSELIGLGKVQENH